MENLPLDKISHETVSIMNTIIGNYREGFIEVDGKSCTFEFVSECENYQHSVCYDVRLSDHVVQLSFESLPPVGFFSKEFEDLDLSSLPEEILPVVMQSLWDPIIKDVQDGLGFRVLIENFNSTADSEQEKEILYFNVNSVNEGLEVRGALYLDLPALQFLSTMLPPAIRRDGTALEHIDLKARVIIARVDLDLDQFKDLSSDDLVLMPHNEFVTNGSCEVVFDNGRKYKATYQNGTVILGTLMDDVEDNEFEEETEMDTTPLRERNSSVSNKDLDESVEEFSTGDLPIHLVFEVGETKIPLQELERLQSGYTFELSTTVDSPVTIRANGRAIGTGKLVQVGDRIGVKVSKFHKA